MNKTKGYLVLALMLSGAVGMTEAVAAGDPKAGEEKAAACMGCHGADGNSEAPNFPKLAGQYAKYIAKQVADFKKELRADDTMGPMAAAVEADQDALDIGAFFAKQTRMKGAAPSAQADKGKEVFAKYNCGGCHGESGKGKGVEMFPVLGGQHKDYLVKQLADFKADTRKNDGTTLMSGIAKRMTDAEIDVVADYLSGE